MNEQLYEGIAKLTLDIIKNVKNINFGGCARFALYLSDKLDKIGVEHEIIVFDYYKIADKRKQINNNILNGKKYSLSCNHVMIKIGKYFIDGEIIKLGIPSLYKGDRWGRYSKQDLKLIIKHGIWNKKYSTRQDTKVKNLIKKHIKIG